MSRIWTSAACIAALAACGSEATPGERPEAAETLAPDRVVVEGFAAPEAAFHDTVADVYLIANLNGDAGAHDGNGFISRVTPDGTVASLKWIDGEAEGVELDAPKGMAVSGDTLFVADIDVVRLFDRGSGTPLGTWPVPGARFLNDAAVGEDGRLYVTDTTAGAVYAVGPDGARAVIIDEALGGPNGIAALPDGRLLVVGFPRTGTHTIDPATGDIEPQPGATTPRSDGVALLSDGGYLISNWEAAAVLRMAPGSTEPDTVVRGVESPADIAWDASRRRVVVPLLRRDRVEIHAIP